MTHGIHGEKRWYALIVLCLGVLMIVLDSTVVNVALPSISTDLHFTETALVWVVNAYLLTFGGRFGPISREENGHRAPRAAQTPVLLRAGCPPHGLSPPIFNAVVHPRATFATMADFDARAAAEHRTTVAA